jgi:hypothetical protein
MKSFFDIYAVPMKKRIIGFTFHLINESFIRKWSCASMRTELCEKIKRTK